MTNVRAYTDEQIMARIKTLPNYQNGKLKGRGLVGVTSNEDAPDIYDDKFYFMDFETGKCHAVLTGTTHAGGSILKGGFKQYNAQGAFVLKRDFIHYDLWTYGLHNNKMPALRQVGIATGYRDGNMNAEAEEIGALSNVRGIGINFHSNTYNFSLLGKFWKLIKKTVSWKIGGWSAGCQVVNEQDEYIEVINWFKEAKETNKQNLVSYVLLYEWEP